MTGGLGGIGRCPPMSTWIIIFIYAPTRTTYPVPYCLIYPFIFMLELIHKMVGIRIWYNCTYFTHASFISIKNKVQKYKTTRIISKETRNICMANYLKCKVKRSILFEAKI